MNENQPKQTVTQQKEKSLPVDKSEPQPSQKTNVGSEPAVDKRKNRLAISFGK